jgi:regulator of protease activity HflC (stomatin/prohibitin superfamily)
MKVLRYEIKNITPPRDVLAAMEKQMRAEREKRAQILTSEGERDAAINLAEGRKQQTIKESEANRQLQINEAARCGLRHPRARRRDRPKASARWPNRSSRRAAPKQVQLRVAEQYIEAFSISREDQRRDDPPAKRGGRRVDDHDRDGGGEARSAS